MKQIAGIDVGKHFLDVSIGNEPVQRYENTGSGHRFLILSLQDKGVIQVVCEATGGYERPLVTPAQSLSPQIVSGDGNLVIYLPWCISINFLPKLTYTL